MLNLHHDQQQTILMKLKSLPLSYVLGAVCAASAMFAGTSRAQSAGRFDLSWSTIDGGGGASSGGQFQLSSTIGQPDAGVLSGGNFKLEGGFWNGITLVQTPGGPILKVKFIGGQAVISWPMSVTGFTLEESVAASGGLWNATPQAVVNTASDHTVTVPAAGVMKSYRLK